MRRNFQRYVRGLHRDIGFLTIGLVVFYSLSGIILIYRDVDFMKHDVAIRQELPKGLTGEGLTSTLKLKGMKLTGEDSLSVNFTQGAYSKVTGKVSYSKSEVIFPFNKMVALHKATSKSSAHWFTALFGVMLLFLGVSSFWMFKSGTRQFRRGVVLAIVGTVAALLLLFIV